MLNKILQRIFPAKKLLALVTESSRQSAQMSDVPRYPPFDRGLPAVSPEGIMHSQSELIDRIERTAGLTPQEYKTQILPVIRNLASYIHLLPATNNSHHRGAGGLFRMSLETALFSLQVANSTIFTNKGSVSTETRYKLHPKWVYATFIAGLCIEIYRPITNMVIVDDQGEEWPQLLMPLHEWLISRNKDRYFIVWSIQDEIDVIGVNQSSTAYLLNYLVPRESLQFLNTGSSEIVSTMTSCITSAGQKGEINQIRQIVFDMRNKVIERDIKSNSERYGSHMVGSHLEPHLIDAMRRLVRKTTWTFNDKGSRIWYSKEGVFIVWQPAAKEIISLLTEDSQPGIPQDADTLADIMITSGIAQRNREDGRYWEICIPKTMQVMPALKLSRVEILCSDGDEVTPTLETLLPVMEETEGDIARPKKAQVKPTQPAQPATPQPQVKKEAAVSKEKSVRTPAPADKVQETQNAQPSPTVQLNLADKVTDDSTADSKPTVKTVAEVVEQTPSKPPAHQSAEDLIQSLKAEQAEAKLVRQSRLGDKQDKLLASLPTEVSEHLSAIIEDYTDKESAGPIIAVEGGMAVSMKEMESHGVSNNAVLIKALFDKNWLWSDPEKPLKKVHDIEVNDEKHRAIIIRSDIARSLGFDWSLPRKGSK